MNSLRYLAFIFCLNGLVGVAPAVYVLIGPPYAISIIDSSSNLVLSTLPISQSWVDSTSSIEFTPDGTQAFALIQSNGTHYIEMINTISAIPTPILINDQAKGAGITNTLALDGQQIYVLGASAATSGFFAIQTANPVTPANPVTLTGIPTAVVLEPSRNKISKSRYAFFAQENGFVTIYNTSSDSIVTAPIAVGDNPVAIALTPGQSVFVANSGSNSVSVIDMTSFLVVAAPDVGTNPGLIAITPDDTQAYVVNLGSNNVSVIDTTSNTVTHLIPVGTGPFSIAIAPDSTPGAGQVYVTNLGSNNVTVISSMDNTVLATVDLGVAPTYVAITPDGTEAYIATESNNVLVINTSTFEVSATIDVGAASSFVAIQPIVPLASQLSISNYLTKPGNR